MKWFLRLIGKAPATGGKKRKTPLPPKPYVDTASTGRHMVDRRLYDPDDLKHIDPEKPHWQDPRFDSRENVPFFDFFGFNRDWSWSMFKLSTLLFVGVMYYEFRTMMLNKDDPMQISGTTNVSPVPDYARDNKATEEELRASGFAYVGVKRLDNLGIASDSLPKRST